MTLADHKNDFYTTVDLTIVLVADGGDVASIAGGFGEDARSWSRRKMVHPDKGTSAHLVRVRRRVPDQRQRDAVRGRREERQPDPLQHHGQVREERLARLNAGRPTYLTLTLAFAVADVKPVRLPVTLTVMVLPLSADLSL